jgi:hypothetical protein
MIHTYRHLLGQPGLTAAIEVDEETYEAKFSYAFCAPSEHSFSRKKGREKADARMAKGICVTVKLPMDFTTMGTAIGMVVFTQALLAFKRAFVFKIVDDKNVIPRWLMEDPVWSEQIDDACILYAYSAFFRSCFARTR